MIFLLLALIFGEVDEIAPAPEEHDTVNYDANDPKVKDLPYKKVFILISDQHDFETDFVRETFNIPPEILSKQIRSKYPGYLEQWLVERRNLNYELIIDPSITGQPLIKYTRNERPNILAYPYKQVPHHVVFLKHIKYLYQLSILNDPEDLAIEDSIHIIFKHSEKKMREGVVITPVRERKHPKYGRVKFKCVSLQYLQS